MPLKAEIFEPKVLQNISIAYRNESYIADQIAPIVRVEREVGKYFIYGKDSFKPVDTLTADGTAAPMATYKLDKKTYSCEPHKMADIITIGMKENSEEFMNIEFDVTEHLTDRILLDYEKSTSTLLRNAATYNTTHVITLAGGSQWNDYNNSDPLQVIDVIAKKTIQMDCGRIPNTIVLPFEVAQTLANHPKIIDLIKYTDPTLLTRSGLPKVFRGLNILEASASMDISLSATSSMTNIWGKDVLVAYVDPKPGYKKFSLAFTFVTPAGGPIRKVREWEVPEVEAMKIEVGMKYESHIIAEDAGYLIKNAVA